MEEKKYTPCKICLETINLGTKKCIKCGSYQNWKYYVGFSNTTISLLIAFISVSSLFVSVIDDLLVEPENVRVSVIDECSTHLKFAISNSGEESAVISPSAAFLSPDRNHLFSADIINESTKTNKDLVINPSEVKIFTARMDTSKYYSSEKLAQKNKKCGYSIGITDLYGKHRFEIGKFNCSFSKI